MLQCLCRERTALSDADIAKLQAVETQLPLMAELGGADVFIDCMTAEGEMFVAAQAGPSTAGSSYEQNVVGHRVLPEKEPAVFHAWEMKAPVRDIKAVTQEGRTVRQNAVPILNSGGQCIAVLIREKDISTSLLHEKKFQSLAQAHEEEDLSLRSSHTGENDLLLREVHHRVKNNLQLVASILRLQARRCGDPFTEKILQENVSRVLSIAAIHDILTKDKGNFSSIGSDVLLEQLRQNLLAFLPLDKRITLSITGGSAPLTADTASSVSLVVNELVTNALEHAFPDHSEGSITISFAPGALFHTVSVSDDGCGFDVSAPRKSLGLNIVEATVKDRLHGKLTIHSGSGGTRAAFDFKTE